MYFEVEKVERQLKELDANRFYDHYKIEEVEFARGKYRDFKQIDIEAWRKFKCGIDKWGDPKERYWFTKIIEIPKHLAGKEVWINLKTGREEDWDLNKNPQFLLQVNDQIVQAFDINHTQCLLAKNAKAGEKYKIDFQAYSGFAEHHVEFILSLSAYDKLSDDTYFDLHVSLEVARRLHENDYRRIQVLSILNEAANMIDFRAPHTPEYYQSLTNARELLAQKIYEDKTMAESYTASCVGHTHIDVAWLWDLEQTREKVVRSFATVLKLMDDYPEYRFMSSQPQLYEFLKEEAPDLYKQVQQKVKTGQWEVEGGMWVEADCNLASGESLIRQFLYGTRFFREEFNKECEMLWLPDVFGYSYALPQILEQFNIKYFMTTKINWNEYNKMPYDTFMWKGIDGTEVLTHFVSATDYEKENKINTFTTYNGMIDANHVMGAWQRYQQKDINDDVLICYGYGDGGGGPTREMLETEKRMNQGIPGAPTVKQSHAKPYFERLEKTVKDSNRLPTWQGELYLEYHRGTYTSMAKSKKYNRKSEQMLHDLEFLASYLKALNPNFEYPKAKLDYIWKIVLLNQFHDILPGTSIKKVYEDSFAQYAEITKLGTELKTELEGKIKEELACEDGLLVYNTLDFERNDYVEVDGEIHYIEGIQPFSANVYKPTNSVESVFSYEGNQIETPYYQITLTEFGELASIYDKEAKREVLKGNGNEFIAFEDKPHHYDAWDINVYYKQKAYKMDKLVEIKVVENTPHRFGLEIIKNYQKSQIKQVMYLYHKSKRIDFDTTIDWKEKQTLLKVAFPINVHAEKATFDIQFGNVERNTHANTSWDFAKFEVVAHRYVDLSEGNYGVSLLSDCKYGYDVNDGVMRMSLIKSAIDPNPDADKEIHQFTYSLFPHNSADLTKTIAEGYKLNNPLSVQKVSEKSGIKSYSFVTTDDGVTIDTIKKAEDRPGYIVRVYDQIRNRGEFSLNFMKQIKTAYRCDLHENKTDDVTFTKNVITDEISPFAIKTYYLEFVEEF